MERRQLAAAVSDADDRIFASPVPSARPTAEWEAIVERLRAQLAAFAGVELATVEYAVVNGVALSAEVVGGAGLGLRAIVGLEAVDGAPVVTAWVFPFAAGVRLTAVGQERRPGYLECRYEPADGGGTWRSLGWQADVYDEFAGVRAPDARAS